MNLQLDQAISREINEILTRAQLSPEILRMINSSINADCKNGEVFKWAHLTLLSCECVSEGYEIALPGAIAMEFFALAADIYDDIEDQDNNTLPWRKLPNANAINLATCLLMLSSVAVSVISNGGYFREVMRILNCTGISASDGQFLEFLYDKKEKVTLDQYFEIVKKKSGSLTACACKIGATLGGATESLVFQLEQFGTNLGIMFQIRNDLNDFLNSEKKNDFVNNTKTLPYVYLLSVLKGESLMKLSQMEDYGIYKPRQEELDYLKTLAIDEGVVHYCTIMYKIFQQKSMDIIKALPVNEKRKEKMINLVQETV